MSEASIPFADRRRLKIKCDELLGEEADIVMDALFTTPDGVASSDEVTVLGTELRTDMAELRTDLRTEMAELRTDLRTEMAELRTELRTEMADLRTEMTTLGSELRTEFHEATTGQTRTMLFGLAGTVISMSTVQLVSLLALA